MLRSLLPPLALALAAALPVRADPAGDEAAIRQRLDGWAAAFNARNAAGACDLFAPDLRYAVPGEARGTRATMCGNLARVLGRDDLVLRYAPAEIHEIILAGDIAIVRLTWTLTAVEEGGTSTTREEGIDVFRRQPDGRWSIARFAAFDDEGP